MPADPSGKTRTVLTPEIVQAEVDKIAACAGDDEAAHSMEDELHQMVLHAIAERRAEDPSACAFVALSTREIKFARWCA